MLQGVHAETIAFVTYPWARAGLLDGGRPLIASASQVLLRGRGFRLQARDIREIGKAVSSQLELRGVERPFTPLIRVEVSFTPEGDNTRVRLRGSTARDLAPAPPGQEESSRRLANAYARSLLEQIAHAIEVRTAEARIDGQPPGPGARLARDTDDGAR